MTKKELKQLSFQLGQKAFHDGKKAMAAHDPEFLNKVITGLKVGESLPYIKEWNRGWHTENLK